MAFFRIDESKKSLIVAVAILTIIASVVFIFATQYQGTPKRDKKPYIAIGEVMAEETAKLLNNQGQVVVVDMDIRQWPMGKIQREAFQKILGKHQGITMAGTENVPMEKVYRSDPGMAFTSEMFFELLSKYPNISAIVSFLGAPVLQDEEIARLGTNIPKIIVLSPIGTGLKKLLEGQVVQVAIVSRSESGLPSSKESETIREWFDRHYQVLSPESESSIGY